MPAEPPPSRIREYTPRDEKQVRFMIGQAQMESLAYANNSSEDGRLKSTTSTFQLSDKIIFSFSVLSSAHSRRVDLRFVHVRPIHELVAKFDVRDLGLAAAPPCVFRPGGAHHVLRRLVRNPPKR
jgi:hypothetical protein